MIFYHPAERFLLQVVRRQLLEIMPKISDVRESAGNGRNSRRTYPSDGILMENEELVMGASSSVLARKINLWMYHAHMSGQGIVATECFLLYTKRAPHFLLSHIVYGVLVPGEVIRPGENGIAGFPCCRIDTLTLVRTAL